MDYLNDVFVRKAWSLSSCLHVHLEIRILQRSLARFCFRSLKLAFRNLPAFLIFRALRSADNFAEGDEDLCGAKAVAHPPAAWSRCAHSCSYIRVHSLTFCFRSLKLILILMFFLACLCVLMSFRHLAEVARETHSAKAVALHRPAYASVHSLTFCFRSSEGFKHRYI